MNLYTACCSGSRSIFRDLIALFNCHTARQDSSITSKCNTLLRKVVVSISVKALAVLPVCLA